MRFCQKCGGQLSNNGICIQCGTEYSLRDLRQYDPSVPPAATGGRLHGTENRGYAERTEYLRREGTERFPTVPDMSYGAPVDAPKKKGKGLWIAVCCGALALGLAVGGLAVWLTSKDKEPAQEAQISEKKEQRSEVVKGDTETPGTVQVSGEEETIVEDENKFNEADYDETGTCGDDLQWGFVEDTGELVIMGTGEMDDYEIEYTDDYESYSTAPWNDYEIESVRLDGVTKIGYAAFAYCEELKEVEWGEAVTVIGEYAFNWCEELSDIKLPVGVEEIGTYAFHYCTGVRKLELPDGVTTIGDGAFYDCDNLETVELPDSLESIGSQAFASSGLTQITIPANVSGIGMEAFEFCVYLKKIDVDKKNRDYMSEDGVLFDGNQSKLICYPAGKTGRSYVVPDGVTVIEQSAFMSNDYVEDVTLPDSLKTLGSWCFAFNDVMTEITIPDSVKTIGTFAFSSCYKLTEVNLGSGIKTIEYGAFDCCDALAEVYYNGGQTDWDKITIEDGNDCLHEADIYGN